MLQNMCRLLLFSNTIITYFETVIFIMVDENMISAPLELNITLKSIYELLNMFLILIRLLNTDRIVTLQYNLYVNNIQMDKLIFGILILN